MFHTWIPDPIRWDAAGHNLKIGGLDLYNCWAGPQKRMSNFFEKSEGEKCADLQNAQVFIVKHDNMWCRKWVVKPAEIFNPPIRSGHVEQLWICPLPVDKNCAKDTPQLDSRDFFLMGVLSFYTLGIGGSLHSRFIIHSYILTALEVPFIGGRV